MNVDELTQADAGRRVKYVTRDGTLRGGVIKQVVPMARSLCLGPDDDATRNVYIPLDTVRSIE